MEPYKDSSKPIEERVADLLSRMTFHEKLAQIGSIWGHEIMDQHKKKFDPQKADTKIKEGIGQITRPGGGAIMELEEVARFTHDVHRYLTENTRLQIPPIFHEEGLFGYQTKNATIFPQSIGLASTWAPALIKEMAETIRSQLREVHINQVLSPVLDVARDPRWGRVEETYGEDPYLVAAMGKAYITGMQGYDLKEGVAATVKHFAGYSVPEGGLNWAPAHIGSRELREVFLFPFEVAVRDAKVKSVMNAYHEIDGIPCGASKELLTKILRDEWGFQGIVVSDYESIKMLCEYHRIAADKKEAAKLALQAGIDIELPQQECYTVSLKEWFEKGPSSYQLLDQIVTRILRIKFQMGLFDQPKITSKPGRKTFDTPKQRQLAREIAGKSIVLLKNDDDLLPLDKNINSIAVIGPNANSRRNLLGDYCFTATLELRDVMENKMSPDRLSEQSNLTVPVVTVLEGIRNKVSLQTEVLNAKGCDVLDEGKEGFDDAIEIAKKAEVAVVVVGGKSGYTPDCTSGEERDRSNLGLYGIQEALIKEIVATGTPVVLVLVDGRPLSIEWVVQHVPAICEAWLPGEEGGNAVADVLFGDVNPGGKLPITFLRDAGQIHNYYAHKPSAARSHLWGNYVDASTKCLFPFGYGLSYTDFELSNLTIDPNEISVNGWIKIEFDIENIGDRKGDEVVQLYVRDILASVTRPVKELKGFKRVTLESGQKTKITFELSTEQLAFYDQEMNLSIEPGDFEVMVGVSSDNIHLTGKFRVTGKKRILQQRNVYFSNVIV